MKFKDLNFPSRLNLELLSTIVPEDKLIGLIKKNATKSRLERRIILPSHRCISKVIAYYFGERVEKGKMNWYQVMEKLKTTGRAKDLASVGLDRKEIKRLFAQRKKEIRNENE